MANKKVTTKKKKAKVPSVKLETIDVVRKAIEKKYGKWPHTLGERGELNISTISTGCLSLDIALGRGGLAQGRVYEIFGPPSGGKCLGYDTYLFTEHGLLTIKELFALYNDPVCIAQKEKEHECGLKNEFGELETTSHFVWNGKRSVKRITTKAGFEVESTYNHKYRIIDPDTGFVVWKKTEDITVHDYLLLNKFGKDVVVNDEITEDEATFLGMLLAEGGLSRKNRVSFTNSDKDMIKLFSDLCNKLYNYTNIKYYNKGVSGSITLDEIDGNTDARVNSKEIRQSLYDNYGLDYVKSKDKNVPIKVRKSSNKVISKFLSAYFSLDGCYENDGSITASSASKELLMQVQLLLLNSFGIKSTVNSKHNKKYDRDYYHLYLGCEDVVLFLEHIGFVLQNKNDKFKKLDINYDSVNRSTMRWNFPYQSNLLRSLCRDVEGNRLSDDIIGRNISKTRNKKLSHIKISEILDYFSKLNPGNTATMILNHLKMLQNYICDQVDNVVDIGEKPVFDVVMPETHSFVSNGFISHNTTLAMSIIAEAQKRGLNAVFVDAEHSADPELFKAMEVDIDKLELIELFVGDDNLDALELYLRTSNMDIAVVDSVSALIPRDEAEARMGDQFMGLLARLMGKALRKLTPVVAETNTLLIFINQVRYKIGGYGDPTTTTGGVALDFYSTGRIDVSGGEFKGTRIEDDFGEIIGHNTTFKIRKNKLAPPFREATIPLIYGKGYDRGWEILKLAIELGIIDLKGAYYYYGEDKYFAQGEANAIEYINQNEDMYNEVRNKIIDMTGLRQFYEQNS